MRKEKTRTQIARAYGVSRRTLYNMLDKADIDLSPGLVSPKEQKEIYHEFGNPFSGNDSASGNS